MAPGQRSKASDAQHKQQKKRTPPNSRPAYRAPKGANVPRAAARAREVLVRSSDVGDDSAKSYWSPYVHADAPLLRTAVGNFTVLTSICRCNVDVAAGTQSYVWVPWSESNVAAFYAPAGYAELQKVTYPQLDSLMPLSVRPLRMGLRVTCTTQTMNRGGYVRVLSHDNLLNAALVLPAVSSDPTFINTTASWLNSVSSSPDVRTYSAEELGSTHELVSVPASYPRYNSYYDCVSVSPSASWLTISGTDMNALLAPRGTYTSGSRNISDHGNTGCLAEVPTMRGFLLLLTAPAGVAQTFQFEIRRQDGARYAANTLGAAFAKPNKPSSAAQEDGLLATIARATQSAADAILPHAVEAAAVAGFSFVKNGITRLVTKAV